MKGIWIELNGDYVIAYKAVRKNGASVFKPRIIYEIGKIYEAHCDYNQDNENSFGLSAWTKERAKEYYDEGKILKVKIHIDDLGVIIDDYKLRCRKLEILQEV